MKYNFKYKIVFFVAFMLMTAVVFNACKKDDNEVKFPIASYQYTVSQDNPLEVSFRNYSRYATSYHWDFGDGIGSSNEENPTYVYTEGGTFNATLTATSDLGSKDHSKEVKVIDPTSANYIKNGGFDDESVWNTIQHNAAANGKVTIADGVAVFDEINDVPPGSWGQEAHVGINQQVEVETGNYFLDLNITTNGLDECWFEVWVGPQQPVDGSEYNEDNGATKVLSFNAWDCGATNNVYSGSMAAASCQDTDGTISLEAGSYWVVIRSGGFNFGQGGIIIDNVKMVQAK